MNIVSTKLMGGLGNMLFQIAAAYSTSLRDNKDMICDTNHMIVPHKSYTSYLNNIFRKIKFSNNIIINSINNEKEFNYSPIPRTEGNLKIIGYFQSEKYFINHKDEINKLFEVDDDTKNKLIDKYGDILNNETCSIHVRRGDYLKYQNHHPIQSIEYYKESIKLIGEDKHFLIFSDDIKWCESNFQFLPNKTFITNNLDYEDLYLMSMCKNNIIANSSFSWWGAWLNQNKDKKVIAPSKWFGISNSHLNTNDLYCDKWIKL